MHIQQKLVAEVKSARYYAVLFDETTDVAHMSQGSLVLRYVDGSGEIHEVFVGFVQVEDATGRGLARLIKSTLTDLGLSLADCRGQVYDGAAAMQGKFQGCETIILEEQPLAPYMYIHCHAHRLNLALSSACDLLEFKNMFGTMAVVVDFIESSTKRIESLKAIIDEDAASGGDAAQHKRRRLKKYCATRWLDRHDTVSVFRELLPYVVKLLDYFAIEGDAKSTASAQAFLGAVKKTQFLVALIVAEHLMSFLVAVSAKLQTANLNLADAISSIDTIKRQFRDIRENCDEEFRAIFAEATGTADVLDVLLEVPRRAG